MYYKRNTPSENYEEKYYERVVESKRVFYALSMILQDSIMKLLLLRGEQDCWLVVSWITRLQTQHTSHSSRSLHALVAERDCRETSARIIFDVKLKAR